jgi:hypothetical protein
MKNSLYRRINVLQKIAGILLIIGGIPLSVVLVGLFLIDYGVILVSDGKHGGEIINNYF